MGCNVKSAPIARASRPIYLNIHIMEGTSHHLRCLLQARTCTQRVLVQLHSFSCLGQLSLGWRWRGQWVWCKDHCRRTTPGNGERRHRGRKGRDSERWALWWDVAAVILHKPEM